MTSLTPTLENIRSLKRASEQVNDYHLSYVAPGEVLVAKNGQAYRCTRYSCGCLDFQKRGHIRVCKHVHLTRAFLDVQPEEAPAARAARAQSDRQLLWGD